MRTTTLLTLIAFTTSAFAQTEVRPATFPFSDGSHATFTVTFDNVEPDDLEAWYKNQLKDLATDLRDKKEIRANGARVPEVAPDTITVLCKAEKPKKSSTTTLHLAFLVNGSYVAATSDKGMVDGAKNFCYTKAVAYKRMVAQKKLEEAERSLARLEGEQATLEKDHRRFEESIEKNKEKGVEAGKEKLQAESDLKTNELAIEAKKTEVATTPTEAGTEALGKLLKEKDKLTDRVQRLGDQVVNSEKKVKDLEQEIRNNLSDQEARKKAIELQRKAVEEARTALAAVN